jgi:hypothetical protein
MAATRWRTIDVGRRAYAWRAGILRHEWTIGVRYEFAPDAWLLTFLCLVLIIGRRA